MKRVRREILILMTVSLSLTQVVQTVSRFARNLDAEGSVRVPRQIGGAPLGPPGPYRSDNGHLSIERRGKRREGRTNVVLFPLGIRESQHEN